MDSQTQDSQSSYTKTDQLTFLEITAGSLLDQETSDKPTETRKRAIPEQRALDFVLNLAALIMRENLGIIIIKGKLYPGEVSSFENFGLILFLPVLPPGSSSSSRRAFERGRGTFTG
jgi:hypothetical protein